VEPTLLFLGWLGSFSVYSVLQELPWPVFIRVHVIIVRYTYADAYIRRTLVFLDF
jgi:hypothetical protein